MSGISLIPVFMIGLLGSVHCIGMCGGIVGAFSATPASRRPFPIPVVGNALTLDRTMVLDDATRVVAYNTGRIGSYAIAGAIAGGLAQGARALSITASIQSGGYWLANLMLVVLGLHLMGAWKGLAHLENIGKPVWRRLQPLMKHFLPMNTPTKALALGALWGWLPCGMAYSVLMTAMMSGSALSGASVMLAFGAGTLPMLLTMGMLGRQLQIWTRRRWIRIGSGLVVLAFGVAGLARAAHGVSPEWLDVFCISSPAVSNPGVHP